MTRKIEIMKVSLPWSWLVCGFLQINTCTAYAQATKPSAQASASANVSQDREKTRLMIEGVNTDKAGAFDNATTFGNSLNFKKNKQIPLGLLNTGPLLVTEETKMVTRQPSIKVPPPIVLNQWPSFIHPDQAVGRISNKRRGLVNQDDSLVYTPDFSRQLMTFGIMAKYPYIDLPDQEISDKLDANNTVDKSTIEINKAKSLADLVKQGLSNSPVIDQALAQIDIAVSKSKQARSELLPKINARYQKGPEKSEPFNQKPNTHTTESSALRLVQPVFNLPAVSDWMAELSNEQATVWRSYAATEMVAMSVTNAVIGVAAGRMVLEFSDEQLEELNKLFIYVQNRAQSGAASSADLERMRARVLQARQSRIEQQSNYKSALLELERLTGEKPAVMQLPYLNQFPGLPATRAQIRQMVWESSQELRILRKDVKTQEQIVASIFTKLLPTLALSIERDEAENARGVNPKQVDSRILGVMNWEFSLGGRDLYAAKLAKAELANRQSKLAEEAERTMQGVDADFALLQSATLRITTSQAEQDAALLVLQSLQQQMKTGRVGSILEALDANERYFLSRQRMVQTLSQQMQAHAQLLRRLGMLSQIQGMVNEPIDINSSMSMVKKTVSIETGNTPTDEKSIKVDSNQNFLKNTNEKNLMQAQEINLQPAKKIDTEELRSLETMKIETHSQ